MNRRDFLRMLGVISLGFILMPVKRIFDYFKESPAEINPKEAKYYVRTDKLLG